MVRKTDSHAVADFLSIGAVVFIGFFGNLIFVNCRIPDVLILLFVGIAFSPDALCERFGLIARESLDSFGQFRDLFLSIAFVTIHVSSPNAPKQLARFVLRQYGGHFRPGRRGEHGYAVAEVMMASLH